jgi:threonine dehydratase
VFGCEVETAAPLSASLAAGKPSAVAYTPSFVDGIGGRGLLPEMWPLVKALLSGSLVVSLDETAEAIRLLVSRTRIVAEGAGAASVAAARKADAPSGTVVCVVSGGNIDASVLSTILAGDPP